MGVKIVRSGGSCDNIMILILARQVHHKLKAMAIAHAVENHSLMVTLALMLHNAHLLLGIYHTRVEFGSTLLENSVILLGSLAQNNRHTSLDDTRLLEGHLLYRVAE